MDKKNILNAEKLRIKIEDSVILDNTSFDVKTSEIVSIIGENGVGKTTLLKAILGEIKLNSGSLEINTDKISYVPQKLNIDKTLPITSLDFIKIFNQETNQTEIKKIAQKYKYNDLLDKKLSSLSGGEFQKILILNALVSSPELVLMDEPTASIDETGSEEFYQNLAEIIKNNENIAFLIVSHNKKQVFAYSDKILHLHKACSCINHLDKNIEQKGNLVEYNHIHDHNHHD